MAATYVRDHIVDSDKTSGTGGLSIVLTVDVAAGNLLVVAVAFDNLSATTPTVSTIDVAAGETNSWRLLAAHDAVSGTPAGIRGELWAIKTSVGWSSTGTSFAITLSAAVAAKVCVVREYSGVDNIDRSTPGAAGTTGAAVSVSTTGTAPTSGDLVIGQADTEQTIGSLDATDSDTLNGAWSTPTAFGTTGGAGASNVAVGITDKIPNASGHQTYDPTLTTGDAGAIIVCLQQTSAATPKTLTDAGSAANILQVAHQLPEVAAAADTVVVSAAAPLAEQAAAADSLGVGQAKTLGDSGTATDQLQVTVPKTPADSGQANDQAQIAAAVPLSDSGLAAELLTVNVPQTLSDNATGVDTLQVSAPKTLGDSATAADTIQVSVAAGLPDSATAGDQILPVAQTPLADQGTTADTLQPAVAVSLPDSGIGREYLAVAGGTLLATNNFNSGSGAVTVGNSGGGNGAAFTSVVGTPAGNTLTYDGTGQALVTLGVTAGEAYAAWDTTVLGSQAQRFARLEPTFTSVAPAGSIRLFRFLGSAASRGAVQLTTTGRLQLINSAGSTVATGTVAVPTGSKIRVEVRIVGDPTVGELELRWWTDPTASGPPTEILLAVGANTGGAVDAIRAGHSGTVQASFSYTYDNLAVANDTWPGAAGTPVILTDSGAATDRLGVAAQTIPADQGQATDTATVAAQVVLASVGGAAADTLTVQTGGNQANLETQWRPAAYDTAASATWVSPHDVAGLALEIAAASQGDQAKTLPDSATAADQLQVDQGVTPKTLTDSATAADSLQVAAQVSLVDPGGGVNSDLYSDLYGSYGVSGGIDSLTVAAAASLAEQGQAADTVQVPESGAKTLTDSADGTDVLVPAAAVTLTQTAAAADTMTVDQGVTPKTLTDSGTAGDQLQTTATVGLPDSGSAADTLRPAAVVSLADQGVAADSLTVGQFEPKTLADSGQATDTATVAAAVLLLDSGLAADSLQPTAAVLLTQQATVADTLQTTQAGAPNLFDQGTAADTLQPAATVSLADQGTAADSLALTQTRPLADQAAAADQLQIAQFIPQTLGDSATAADQLLVAATAPLGDQAGGSEALLPVAAVSLPDTGQAADSLVAAGIGDQKTLADSGQAAEQVAVTQAKLLTDQGAAADQFTVNVGRVLTDQGSGSDSLRPTALAILGEQATTADVLALSALSVFRDSGTVADTMVVLTVAYWIRTSSQEPATTSVSKEPAGTTDSREPALATSSREKGTL